MRFQEFSQFKIRPHLFENKQQYKQIVDTMVNGGVIDRAEAENTLKDAKSLLKRADRITWWLRWWRIAKTGEVFQDRMEDLDSKSRESETAQEKQEYRAEIRNLGKQFEKLTKKSFLDYLDDSSDFPSVFDLHALKNHWSAKFEQSPQINHVE